MFDESGKTPGTIQNRMRRLFIALFLAVAVSAAAQTKGKPFVFMPQWTAQAQFAGYYAALAIKGFFPFSDLEKLRHPGFYLQGHPDMKHTPGCDMTSGSLGLGLSAAAGMALGAKHQGKGFKVYAVCGDGELAEGQIWEAAMFSAHYKLDNLCVFVDWNGLQIDGRIVDVMNSTPIDEKFAAFGWHVQLIDGHDFDQIENAVNEASKTEGKPSVIIMKTTKGKGVSYMENQVSWHGAAPNEEQYKQGMAELQAALAALDE